MPFRILFVCSGNTCRSPLAEAIVRRLLAREGLDGCEVSSAGLYAEEGGRASAGALEVARENDLDLESFVSRRVSKEILEEADVILVMEPEHRSGVLGRLPAADTKTFLLGELVGAKSSRASVPDPFGGPVESYRRAFRRIDRFIRRAFPRIRELALKKARRS